MTITTYTLTLDDYDKFLSRGPSHVVARSRICKSIGLAGSMLTGFCRHVSLNRRMKSASKFTLLSRTVACSAGSSRRMSHG